MENLRRYPRKRFDRAVKCITTRLMFDCRGVNLSEGGICLRSPMGFAREEGMALLIPVGPDEDGLVLALGKVVWIEHLSEGLNDYPICAGIQFLATAGKNQAELAKICQAPE